MNDQARLKPTKLLSGFFTPVLLCAIVASAGCSNNKPTLDNTQFHTKITSSGLKHFEVLLAPARPPMGKNNPQDGDAPRGEGAPPRSGPPGRHRVSAKTLHKTLVSATELHLQTSHFCTSGYWVMEEDILRPVPRLRGECNEVATEEDHIKFPDTVKQW